MKTQEMALSGNPYTTRLVLLLSGIVAVAIAGTILTAPDVFYAGYGIQVGGNATLANELKAPAAALLVAGLLMFAGVFRSRFVVASLVTATLVYLSYGMGRVVSIAIDGLPHSGMVGAAGIEIVIGAVCLMTLLHVRSSRAN